MHATEGKHARQRRDRLRRRQRSSYAKVPCSPSTSLEAAKEVLGNLCPGEGSEWTTREMTDKEIGSGSANFNSAEANEGRVSGGDGPSACEGFEGGAGCCLREEDNPLLPFALMSEELFHASPVSRRLGPASECGSERDPGSNQGQIVPLALPPPPSMSEDLRLVMEQIEDTYKGMESAAGDNVCLSKGEVTNILTRVENFMESQTCDTAKKIGVSFDGVDKGLKSSMLLIKRRLLADMARKAKADVAGKCISEES